MFYPKVEFVIPEQIRGELLFLERTSGSCHGYIDYVLQFLSTSFPYNKLIDFINITSVLTCRVSRMVEIKTTT